MSKPKAIALAAAAVVVGLIPAAIKRARGYDERHPSEPEPPHVQWTDTNRWENADGTPYHRRRR